MQVFLSHGSEDTDIAKQVTNALEELCVQVLTESLKLSRGERAESANKII